MDGICENYPDLNIKNIHCVYYSKRADWKRPLFSVRRYDGVVLLCSGEIEYDFGFTRLRVKKGDILAFPGNLPYSGVKVSDEAPSFIVIDFLCHTREEFSALGLPLKTSGCDFELYRTRFSEILSIYTENTKSSYLRLKAELYNLISNIYEMSNPMASRDLSGAVLRYIGEHFRDSSLRVSDICEEFFISESQLRRNIIKATGKTPVEYISALRLDFAKNELCYTSRPIKDISASCGFSSQYYFSKCFSARFGVSPTAYRERYSEVTK